MRFLVFKRVKDGSTFDYSISEIFMEEGTFELNMECTEHGWADSEI